jgi:DNA polymerase
MTPEIGQELREILHSVNTHLRVWREMGLEALQLSDPALAYLERPASPILPVTESAPSTPEARLAGIREEIGACTRCKLHRSRKRLVFGEGSPAARLVFVGEGPGFDEDRAGRPFVGESGRLLTRIIQAMGLTREQVYICNVVKCHPPGNRNPEPDEVQACLGFLKAQLAAIHPRVICLLGAVAARALFGNGFTLRAERGRWQTYMDIPVMPTFHPAYLLRNEAAKRPVWQDVQQIMRYLEGG